MRTAPIQIDNRHEEPAFFIQAGHEGTPEEFLRACREEWAYTDPLEFYGEPTQVWGRWRDVAGGEMLYWRSCSPKAKGAEPFWLVSIKEFGS